MHKSIKRKVGISRPSSSLPPPPLFRSIGPPGTTSASLPPHRRLRSMFCRSRAVLPANTHPTEASDTQTGSTVMCPLGCNDALSEDLHRRADARSANPQLLSHLCASRGRQGRSVTPLQTSEDPTMKEKRQQKRKKRSYKVDCAGKHVVPPLTEKEEDGRLCEWLQSLGIADEKEQQRLFVSRCRDTAARHRRDRRPHFLPPICQSDSLLRVPVLLPENSPPPSPCPHPPDAPIHSLRLAVPRPQPPSRRK